MITTSRLSSVLLEMEKKHGTEKAVEIFTSFISEKKLNKLLPSIERKIKMMIERKNEGNDLVILTSFELSQSKVREIKKVIGAPDAESERVAIIPDIVGGFEVFYKSKKFQASIDHSLHQLGDQLRS
jgi:F0F1-type ATP synthase delta subunit